MLPFSEPTDNSVLISQTRNKAPSAKNAFGGCSYIRTVLCRQGVPEETADAIIKSWRVNTQKQYEAYIKSWLCFCRRKDNAINPNINTVPNFLTKLFKTVVSYSTMGTARSAISTFLLEPITLRSYTHNQKLCIGWTMKEYLDRTKYLRMGSELMISSLKASKTTISRWLKTILTQQV